MSLHIDVGSVLRGTVCDLYSNLLTRSTGAAVRTAIERQVEELGVAVVTTIDFSQVNLLDFSCADEIVAKLLLRYADDDRPMAFLLFRGILDEHLDPIETVLEHHSLALVSWHQGVAELFGAVDASERLHWEAVRDHGPLWAEDVAALLSGDTDGASQQLNRLARRRLVMRRADGFAVPRTVMEVT